MSTLNDTDDKLEKAFRNSFSLILTENDGTINELDDIKTVASWYREANQDPNRIPSLIVNGIIKELLNHSKEYFINSITENVKIQFEINSQQREVKGDIRINFKSVKPYVEFIKVIDGGKVPPALRFTFKIDIDGTFKGLKFSRSISAIPTATGEVRRGEITLDKLSFDLTISIIKLPAFNLIVPILLYHKEQFKVENLHFYL
jgi:hypothetical protein